MVTNVAPTPLRHNRDFLALWGGEALSTLGSQISLVAFPLLVLATTHSPSKAGLVGFANQVPGLVLYLPAGVLVDRHDRRIMVLANLVGAVAMAAVPVGLLLGHLPFGVILVAALLAGARQVVYGVAEQGALPLVVAPEQVKEAVVRNEARYGAALLAGPPLGGVLFGFARFVPFAADAVSYLASAVGAYLIRTPLQEPRRGARRHVGAEIAEAMRWLWAQPFLRASALAVAASNFTWLAIELVLIVRVRQAGASSAAVGAMVALVGIGGLIGALLATRIVRAVPDRVIVIGSFWVETIILAALVLSRDPYVLGAIAAVGAMFAPAWNAVVVGARLTLTTDELRGRVTSCARLISGGLMALGPLAAGALSQSLGTTGAILAFVGWQLALSLAATATPSLRAGLPKDASTPQRAPSVAAAQPNGTDPLP